MRLTVAKEEGGSAVLCVDDDGPGIPAVDRERVFDRFYRREPEQPSDDVRDEAAQGSGLGLAIVRRIAERHGAAVTLESSPLGGLRVRVRFG